MTAYAPERVHTPTPLHISPGQALNVPQSLQQPPAYVIAVQQAAPVPSWARQHAGQLVAAGGAGVLAVAVAVAAGIGAISCAIGWLVIKTLMGSQMQK